MLSLLFSGGGKHNVGVWWGRGRRGSERGPGGGGVGQGKERKRGRSWLKWRLVREGEKLEKGEKGRLSGRSGRLGRGEGKAGQGMAQAGHGKSKGR